MDTSTQICTICRDPKPFSAFEKRRDNPPLYRHQCYKCRDEQRRNRYKEHPEVFAHRQANQTKNRLAHAEAHTAHSIRYYWNNRDKVLAKWAARYQKNKTEILARQKARHWSASDAGKLLRECKYFAQYLVQKLALYECRSVLLLVAFQHIEKRREKARATNRAWHKSHQQRRRELAKRYRINNPEKYRARKSLYDARKRGAKTAEPVDRQAVIARDGSRCHICKKKVKRADMSLDHLIPLSQGGPHIMSNLAVAHRLCNSRRSDGHRIPAQLRLLP